MSEAPQQPQQQASTEQQKKNSMIAAQNLISADLYCGQAITSHKRGELDVENVDTHDDYTILSIAKSLLSIAQGLAVSEDPNKPVIGRQVQILENNSKLLEQYAARRRETRNPSLGAEKSKQPWPL
jgi:hypothetical protein